MYRVIKHFADLQDKNHEYHAGDTFPRAGLEVKEERIAELFGKKNKQGVPLIVLAEEKKAPAKKVKATAEK